MYSWFGSTSPSGQLLPGSPVSGHCFQGRWKWRSHLKGGSSGDQGDLSPALNFQHSSKIPTVILYDTTGTARAFGAEAESEDKQEEAFKGGWKEAKYFKLKLHPATIQSPVTMGLRGGRTLVVGPVIPFGVSLERCYADFIGYLCGQTKSWFKENTVDGKRIWQKLSPSRIKLVLAHPNGWSIDAQEFLRKAVEKANIACSITMVTEGEASVHFAITYTPDQSDIWLSRNTTFVTCDAGGSTTEVCVYNVVRPTPQLQLREVNVADCVVSL